MNLTKTEKLYLRLSELELEYLKALVEILSGKNLGFTTHAYFWRKSSKYVVGKKWGNAEVDQLEHLEKEIRQLRAKLKEPISGSVVGVIDEYGARRSATKAASDDKALEREYYERLNGMLKEVKK